MPCWEWNGSGRSGVDLVARCWALRNQAPVPDGVGWSVFSVVVWLLDSGREHLCSCLLRLLICFRSVDLLCCVVFVCVATSYEGRMVDALASRADEGRRSLR